MNNEEGTHNMCKCSLPYDKLVKAIEKGECDEHERLKDDKLNKFSIIHRVGGITYCYGWYCQHRKKDYVQFQGTKRRPTLNLTEKEKEYVKKQGWDFLLDEKWVAENIFIPVPGVDKEETLHIRNSATPGKSHKQIEDGDIVIFDDYSERTDSEGKFHTNRFYEWDESLHNEDSCPSGRVVKSKD